MANVSQKSFQKTDESTKLISNVGNPTNLGATIAKMLNIDKTTVSDLLRSCHEKNSVARVAQTKRRRRSFDYQPNCYVLRSIKANPGLLDNIVAMTIDEFVCMQDFILNEQASYQTGHCSEL